MPKVAVTSLQRYIPDWSASPPQTILLGCMKLSGSEAESPMQVLVAQQRRTGTNAVYLNVVTFFAATTYRCVHYVQHAAPRSFQPPSGYTIAHLRAPRSVDVRGHLAHHMVDGKLLLLIASAIDGLAGSLFLWGRLECLLQYS